MCRAIRRIAFFWHSRQKKEDNPKCPHLKFYQNIWSPHTLLFEHSLLDHCLKVQGNDVTPTIWCHKDKIADKEWWSQAPYLDISIRVSLFGYFAPRINVSAKWCHISSPAALEGRPIRGGPWTPLGPVLPERFREGTSSEGSKYHKQALSSDSPTWCAPTPPPQSYPSQAPLGAQRPDTSGNNI